MTKSQKEALDNHSPLNNTSFMIMTYVIIMVKEIKFTVNRLNKGVTTYGKQYNYSRIYRKELRIQ